MSLFRPCIDLHQGKVKQIVGASFLDHHSTNSSLPSKHKNSVQVNFESNLPASYYAKLYQKNALKGGHMIQLGQSKENKLACLSALKAYPKGLQVGGGINEGNASYYLKKGASHVIITSCLFPRAQFDLEKLKQLSQSIGKKNLVVDLSCKKVSQNKWMVAIDGWKTITDYEINASFTQEIEPYCDEFLIHATHVEGLSEGVDLELIQKLSQWVNIPTTYAGGVKSIQDLKLIKKESQGKIDITVGSSLDLFGGNLVQYQDCLQFNSQN